ncbi:MAG: sulfur carrier protein ThiS [Bacteroidia bacterium]|nr:sulfur carrier protein ThiS [Bacteroidia bacterium]
MQILLNNNIELIDRDSISIADILNMKNYTFKLLVIKLNNRVINKPEYGTTFVKDGDDVKIIHLMSGG